ncbi:hypothetical protein [Bradyrhizobium sp. UFLA05-112]
MNRHTRRSEISGFRRQAQRNHLLTYLIEADAPLDRHPLLRKARDWWRSTIQRHRPYCIACQSNFADEASPGAFLFGVPSLSAKSASVSALCEQCWRDLPPETIEADAAKALQLVVPNGRFDP